jgi:hypothetical protein
MRIVTVARIPKRERDSGCTTHPWRARALMVSRGYARVMGVYRVQINRRSGGANSNLTTMTLCWSCLDLLTDGLVARRDLIRVRP